MQRVVGFLALALVIFYIITQPTSAAHAVQSLGHVLRDAAESMTLFFRELT